MGHKAPSFLGGSPSTTASGFRGQFNNCFQELDDDGMEIEDDKDLPLSIRGVLPPREPGTSHGDLSVRRPPGPPLHQDLVGPSAPRAL